MHSLCFYLLNCKFPKLLNLLIWFSYLEMKVGLKDNDCYHDFFLSENKMVMSLLHFSFLSSAF